MKKNKSKPSRRHATLFIILALMTAACTNNTDDHQPTKTPITLGQIGITLQTNPAARAEAEEHTAAQFFQEGDILDIAAIDIETEEPTHTSTAAWNSTTQQFGNITPVIYYEDVHNGTAPTHTFKFRYFLAEDYDQSTPELLHKADFIEGNATLTADRKLSCTQMTRPYTIKVVITLTKGTGWASDQAFAGELKANALILDTYKPYIDDTNLAADGTLTLTAIVNSNDIDPANLEILTIGNVLMTYEMPDPAPKAGQLLNISATFHHVRGLDGITVNVNDWKEGNTNHTGEIEVPKN